MRIIECTQGDDVWRAARLGIPTSSCFDKIITEKTEKFSEQSKGYMLDLCVEHFTGHPVDVHATGFMERGKDLEAEGREWYALANDVEPQRIGFAVSDDGLIGCSPDSLVGDDGGLEIKVHGAKAHLLALYKGIDPLEHRCQIQGCMWLTGRKWWDRLYYHPEWPSPIVRIERDEEFIGKLSVALGTFNERLAVMKQFFIDRGLSPRKPDLEEIRERKARDAEGEAEFDRIVAASKMQPVDNEKSHQPFKTEHEAAMAMFDNRHLFDPERDG